MNRIFKTSRHFLLLAVMGFFSLVLAGCGGGGSSGTASSSSLTLGVTDAPVDGVSAVVIEFTKVQVHSSTGSTLDFTLSSPKQIDLLQLTSGKSTLLLDHESLPTGQYDWIRLYVDETHSYVTDSTGDHAMTIPSNAQTGLKLNHPFTIDPSGVASFIIDFNLRQSLHMPMGGSSAYILRPTLRIVSATVTGGITGTVDPTLINDPSCADLTASGGTVGGTVYVYSGANVTPVDVNTTLSSVQPLSTASVVQVTDPNTNVVTWQYTAAYLDPMDYTVVFTCQSSLDNPDTTDSIAFVAPANVTVTSGVDTVHDFP
jgi:hypothetical protein